MILLFLSSCGMNIDFMMHNGVHCSNISKET